LEVRAGGKEEAARVEQFVAEALEKIVLEGIRIAAGESVDEGTAVASILGVEGIGQDTKPLEDAGAGLGQAA
jgi:hypothetical protein